MWWDILVFVYRNRVCPSLFKALVYNAIKSDLTCFLNHCNMLAIGQHRNKHASQKNDSYAYRCLTLHKLIPNLTFRRVYVMKLMFWPIRSQSQYVFSLGKSIFFESKQDFKHMDNFLYTYSYNLFQWVYFKDVFLVLCI